MPNDSHDAQGRFASGGGSGGAEKIGGGKKSTPRMMTADETRSIDRGIAASGQSEKAHSLSSAAVSSGKKADHIAASEAHGTAARMHANLAAESNDQQYKSHHEAKAESHRGYQAEHMKAAKRGDVSPAQRSYRSNPLKYNAGMPKSKFRG